jgi:DNA repair exonuclease SbcCD ATPase subunit
MSTVEENQQTYSPEMSSSMVDGTNRSQLGGGHLPEGGNIDKIREILFGVQMRDYEKRFSRLEERLLKESADLREDTRRRFDALETFIRKELDSLADRLKSEQGTRDESVQELSRSLQDTGKALERKIAQLDEQTTRNQSDIRQQILNQSKSLSDEIRQKYEELTAMLEREAVELRHDKTDRSALAALFTEVALRLNNEFKIPGDV